MARTKDERERRRQEAKQRAERRQAAKASKASTRPRSEGTEETTSSASANSNDLRAKIPLSKEHNADLPAMSLPVDALAKVLRFLTAREFGAMLLTCTSYNESLGKCRVAHISSRLMRRKDAEEKKQSTCGSLCLVGGLELCLSRKEAQVR